MRFPLPLRALTGAALAIPLLVAVPSVATADPVVPVELITFDPNAETTAPDYKLAYALREAEAKALASPTVYGQPYVRWSTLYLPVVTAEAQAEAAQPIALPPDLVEPDDGTGDPSTMPPPETKDESAPAETATATAAAPKSETQRRTVSALGTNPYLITPKTPLVKYSLAQLEAIKDEVLTLTPDVLPGVDRLFAAMIQPERHQVLVETDTPTDALRTALATRYGSDAVVVRQVEDPYLQAPDSRNWDTSPFWGGAWIRTGRTGKCSNAFSWRVSGASYMLSAGHCTNLNGYVNTPAGALGRTTHMTWAHGRGSIAVSGTYRGDLALIKVDSGKSSNASIYVGGVTSSNGRAVGAMWSRRSAYGDTYCTGGVTTGELCGWMVQSRGVTLRYSSGETVRNVVRGTKRGYCTRGGDSGGSVYSVNSAGKVVAKGVHSGHGGGGSDSYGGALDPCYEYFTDIWDAYYGLPGTLATR